MRAWAWLALLLMASGGAQAADYLMTGSDAARSGARIDDGPHLNETAFVARLGGIAGPVVVVNGSAFTTTVDSYSATESTLWRVRLDTGEATDLAVLPYQARSLVSDGTFIYTATGDGYAAYDLDGVERWRAVIPSPPERIPGGCGDAVLHDGMLIAPCYELDELDELAARLDFQAASWYAFAVAFDVEQGALLWRWEIPSERAPAGVAAPVAVPDVVYITCSATGNTVLVYVAKEPGVSRPESLDTVLGDAGATSMTYVLYALDSQTGVTRWSANDTLQVYAAPGPASPLTTRTDRLYGAYPTTDANLAYIRLDETLAINLATGARVWSRPIGQTDVVNNQGSSSLGRVGGTLLLTSSQTRYAVDAATGEILWQASLPPQDHLEYGIYPILSAGGLAYADVYVSGRGAEHGTEGVVAYDIETGEEVWRRLFQGVTLPEGWGFTFRAMSGGLYLVTSDDGTLTAIGRTAASMPLEARVDELAPARGERVRLDVDASAGLYGAPTAYRVEWGDGDATDWQTSPRFEHAYEAAGPMRAVAYARNDGGQSSAQEIRFDVGGPRLTPLQRAFSPQNENITFFVIGLALTGAGAVAGLLRRGRRTRAFRREKRAIDREEETLRAEPQRLERAMMARLDGIRELRATGKLDEAQYDTLKERASAIYGEARAGEVEALLEQLPHGFVNRLRQALRDGRLERWERDALLLALDQDPLVNAEARAEVRARIDAWFREDRLSRR